MQNLRNFLRSLFVAGGIVHHAAYFRIKTFALQDFVVLYFLEVIKSHSLDISVGQIEIFSKQLNFGLAFSQVSIVAIIFVHRVVLQSLGLLACA